MQTFIVPMLKYWTQPSESLRVPDSGAISVLGMNPQKESRKLGNRIGTQLQQAALSDRMKVWEALDLYASFYERTVPWEPLLE